MPTVLLWYRRQHGPEDSLEANGQDHRTTQAEAGFPYLLSRGGFPSRCLSWPESAFTKTCKVSTMMEPSSSAVVPSVRSSQMGPAGCLQKWSPNIDRYLCLYPLCSGGFTRASDLDRHLKQHFPLVTCAFACPVGWCPYRSNRRDKLTEHQRRRGHHLAQASLDNRGTIDLSSFMPKVADCGTNPPTSQSFPLGLPRPRDREAFPVGGFTGPPPMFYQQNHDSRWTWDYPRSS